MINTCPVKMAINFNEMGPINSDKSGKIVTFDIILGKVSVASLLFFSSSHHLTMQSTVVAVCLFLAVSASSEAELKGQEPIGPLPDYICPHDGVFAVPEACEQFIECWSGEAVLWTCTDRMLFDLVYDGCNYAQYVHCEERPRPTDVPSTVSTVTTTTTTHNPNISTTTPPPNDYDCPEGDGIFAHEERCEYYWNCWAGEATLFHCQEDYLFDRQYLGCNFPALTDCDHRLRPNGTNPTTITTRSTTTTTEEDGTDVTDDETAPTGNGTTVSTTTTTRRPGGEFECPSGVPDGNHADPENCSSFYTCVGGIAYRYYCPIPLYYDEPRDLCDYRNNVDCGTRP